MSIKFIKEYNTFKLDSNDTSYIISIVDDEKFRTYILWKKNK